MRSLPERVRSLRALAWIAGSFVACSASSGAGVAGDEAGSDATAPPPRDGADVWAGGEGSTGADASAVLDATEADEQASRDVQAGEDASVDGDGDGDAAALAEANAEGGPIGCDGALATIVADAAPPASCRSVAWSRVAGSPSGTAIMGSGPTDLWVLSQALVYPTMNPANDAGVLLGALMRGDGTSWTTIPLCGAAAAYWLDGVDATWVNGPNDVWVAGCAQVGENDLHHWDGCQWTTYGSGDGRWVRWLWGSGPNDVWGTGTDGDLYLGHWDGQNWWHVDSIHSGPMGGAAPADFWNGTGTSDGVTFTAVVHHLPSGQDVAADLSTLGRDAGLSSFGQAVWASDTSDVWVLADAGRVLYFDGAGWFLQSTPTTATLRGLWGTSRTDVWAVGDGGALVHFDGFRWSAPASPTTHDLAAVWASGPCDVWAIGDAIYHGVGQP